MGAEARAEFEVWYQENAPAFFKSTYPVADAAWAVWQHSRATLAAVERERDALRGVVAQVFPAVMAYVESFGTRAALEEAIKGLLDLGDAARHALGRDEAGTKGGNGA